MAGNNAINNTLQTPFTVGSTSVTSTGTQLNYLAGLTAVPINKIGTQTITATGAFTYTATSGTKYAIFEMVGGGGGSGGTTGTGGQQACAGPGGGGSYLKLLVSGTANLAAITGSIGGGGAAGASGNNPGGAGSATTLTINGGSVWQAGAGAGGQGQASSILVQAGGAPGGPSANTAGTNATVIENELGCAGTWGFTNGASYSGIAGLGGASRLGFGSLGGLLSSGHGGGAGGNNNFSGVDSVGFAGGGGICIVTEFISA